MAENSKIEWTDHTFNPWRGCTKVSDGCKNCYAANMGRRFGVDWGPGADRVPATEAMWQQPHKWNRAAARDGVRRRVFCASMADVFDDHPSILPDWRDRLWQTIRDTPHLDWLLLTKRSENFLKYLPNDTAWDFSFDHVWLGVSAESQNTADVRIEILNQTPSSHRFLSIEPMLDSINLSRQLIQFRCACCGISSIRRADDDFTCPLCGEYALGNHHFSPAVDWVICGGETGPGARPMNLDWARSLRDQCVEAGVPFFFKSTGGREKSTLLDGRTWREFPE